jgi:hypothetical protein
MKFQESKRVMRLHYAREAQWGKMYVGSQSMWTRRESCGSLLLAANTNHLCMRVCKREENKYVTSIVMLQYIR